MVEHNPTPPGLLAGRLEGVRLPDLVWALHLRRQNGVLRVTRSQIQRTLHFKEGQVVFASSSDPNDRLGEMLLRSGKITLDQLEAGLIRLNTGKRLGTLLVEVGSLTAEQLVTSVLSQVKSIVLDLLSWEDGEYQFKEGRLPTHEAITLEMCTGQLLLEAIRRVTSFGRIRTAVGAPRNVFALTETWEQVLGELHPTEGEQLIVDRLQAGASSVEELCRDVMLSNFEIYRALWFFRVVGLVCRREGLDVDEETRMEGRLGPAGLAAVLVRLRCSGETGVLYLSRGALERSIHVREGGCVFATSNDPDDGLLAYLLRRGVIALRDREETSRRLLSNKRVGTILLEMGVIDDRDLHEMVRQQVCEILYDTFRWEHGEYQFVAGVLPSAEEITLDLKVDELVASGIRRIDSWTRVIRGCGGVDNPLQLAANHLEVLDAMGAGVDEWAVVEALNTPQTPRRICRQVDLDDFRMCQILWCLMLLGAVEPASLVYDEALPLDAPVPPAPEPVAEEPLGAADERPHPDVTQLIRREDVEAAVAGLPAEQEADPEPVPAPEPEPEPEPAEEVFLEPGVAEGLELLEAHLEQEAEPAEPAWEPPVPLDGIIERFNAMHRELYRAMRTEIGAGATNFVRSCCIQSVRDGVDILSDVELLADGSWDAGGLRRAICDARVEDPWPFYQDVLDREFVQLQPHLGEAKAVELKQRIWELQQAHAAG